MIASKREKIVAMIAAGVIGLLVADRFVISTLFDRSGVVDRDISAAEVKIAHDQQLEKNAPRNNDRWRAMQAAGLKAEATVSESQALRALHEWAKESGVAVVSLQPDRAEVQAKQKEFVQQTLRMSGTGSLRAISQYLQKIQAATIPLKVTNIEVTARAIGTDDLSLTLAVSTLSLSPQAQATGPAKREGT